MDHGIPLFLPSGQKRVCTSQDHQLILDPSSLLEFDYHRRWSEFATFLQNLISRPTCHLCGQFQGTASLGYRGLHVGVRQGLVKLSNLMSESMGLSAASGLLSPPATRPMWRSDHGWTAPPEKPMARSWNFRREKPIQAVSPRRCCLTLMGCVVLPLRA